MEVILLERVEKLGQMGDIVSVRNGFARNFLLPQKKALRATEANKAVFEADKARLEADNLERRTEAEAVAKSMDGLKVVMVRAAGESGQLYGSVTSRDLADAITEAGVKVARNQVILDRALKTIGLHDVHVRLHPEVSVDVTVNIARSVEEAETQFETGSALVASERFESDFESAFGEDEDEELEAEEVAVEAAAAEGEEEAKEA
ncbi:50S ribosomal protein L9 [Kordiimonas marina]|uniref:50S ribosomal protein L9 n=1 Tax=Kordiimonas marina TaxID=2872312 RepID=UPI001FF58A64|nr:50S ribosomal protein L9 [Kordiimonas marina]MCJ9428948.1 50S ribosomal protein L9 [Kordiimonas marina]